MGCDPLPVLVNFFESGLVDVRVGVGRVVVDMAVLMFVLYVFVVVGGVGMRVSYPLGVLVLMSVRVLMVVFAGHHRSFVWSWVFLADRVREALARSSTRCSTWRRASSSSVER